MWSLDLFPSRLHWSTHTYFTIFRKFELKQFQRSRCILLPCFGIAIFFNTLRTGIERLYNPNIFLINLQEIIVFLSPSLYCHLARQCVVLLLQIEFCILLYLWYKSKQSRINMPYYRHRSDIFLIILSSTSFNSKNLRIFLDSQK